MRRAAVFASLIFSVLFSVSAFAQVQTTVLSGTVIDQSGSAKSGMKLYVVRTLKDGVLVASPQTVATSGAGGAISLTVLRGSTIYLYSRDIPRFSDRGPSGMPFAIPDTPTASLENLALLSSVMVEQGDTVTAGANGRPVRIAGNTSETPKFWRQVGSSGIAGLPTWAQPMITELGDVLITNPTNGQVIKYNSSIGKFTNQADATGGGGGGSLTVQEVDGSPAVSDVSVLEFAESVGFVVTDQTGGTARVSLNAVPYSALALTGAILNADINASAAIDYSKLAALTADRLLISDASGFVSAAAVTATEAGYLSGVTSAIQTQLDAKGTVTSVGLSLPAIFSVSGSPVTGSGTLVGSLATQVANTVWAGPATGVDAAPTFRSLVAADIPSHNQAWSTITSTPTTLSGYGITDAQGLDADLTALAGLSSTGIIARTASATFTERTLTGTSNRITITNGDGVSGNPTFDVGSDVVTLTGSQTLTNKTLTSPTINGGAISALTGLGIRSTGTGAFDLTIANSENLTAGRTLTIAVGDTDRTLTVGASASISGSNTGDQTITLTGDVTGSGTGSFATTIGSNKVTLGMMAQVATARFLGRTTAGTGDVEALTAAQATALLDAMVGDSGSGGMKGLVPAPASGDAAAGKFLKADGTWAAPAGGGSGTVNSGSQYQFAYYASAGTAVSGTSSLVTDASGLIGINKTSSIGAQLHVVSGSASRPAAIFASAPTPSSDVLQVSADNGTTTHFRVTSTGAPSGPTGTNSERFGAGSAAASSTRAISIGNSNNAGSGTDIISIGYGTALGGAAGTNITIGNSNSHSITDFIAIGHGINNSATKGIVIGNGLIYQYAGGNNVINANFGSGTFAVFKAANMFGGNGVAHETAGTFAINGTGGYGTDKVGGDLYLVGGRSTGSAISGNVTIKTAIAGTTGSTMNSTVDRYIVNANRKSLTDASTNIFEVALPTLKGTMGTIRFEIYASDGTDVQVRSGVVHYSAVNKGGSYTTNITVMDERVVASAGTLTATWGITGGTNKVTIDVTPSGSLTETTYYILYTIENNSEQAITIL